MNTPFKIFPDMSPAEYKQLKQQIKDHGIPSPTIKDQLGQVLFGLEQERIAKELGLIGLKCPVLTRTVESDKERLEIALIANSQHRQLNGKAKRYVIDAALKIDAEISDAWLGDKIGCSPNTVKVVRRNLEAAGEIARFSQRKNRDGRKRPATLKPKQIITNTEREASRALELIMNLPDSAAGKILDLMSAERRVRKAEYRKARQQDVRIPSPLDAIKLYHCCFSELLGTAGLQPESVAYICTDIPYIKDFMSKVETFGQVAHQLLKPQGILTAYCGTLFLPDVLESLKKSLDYRWVIAQVLTPAQPGRTRLHKYGILQGWKPIVLFSKGPLSHHGFNDVMPGGGREKEWHPWQQSLPEAIKLVESFTKPADLVCDPFGGSFTTAIACLMTGRRFIGCDIERQNVLNGQERVAEMAAQLKSAG